MPGGVRYLRFLAIALVMSLPGCGGGSGVGSSGGDRPPPLHSDFGILLSSGSLAVTQGDTSPPITLSVVASDGFSGSVSVTLEGIPAGITTNPVSPFTVTSGQPAPIIIGAASNATTGQFSISAQGTNGNLSHSATLGLTVQAGTPQNLSRSTFVRNDSVPAVDNPTGEPHRRHLVYDAAGQRFFVANRAMNRVDVVSTADSAIIASIDAPGAASVDLSPDGLTLWVGTALEQILAIDTTSLQVKKRYPIAGVTSAPGVVYDRPTEIAATASGGLLVRLTESSAAQSLLALWDPASNSFANLTSAAPAIFQNGLGVMARSADYTHLIVAANAGTGDAAVFGSSGNLLAGPQSLGAGAISSIAINADGSRFAAILGSGGNSQLLLFDSLFNPLGNYAAGDASGLLFSRDGQVLYVAESLGNGRVITALSGISLQQMGQIPDLNIEGVPSMIEDSDASQMLCGLSNRGISFLDASHFVELTAPAPSFAAAPVAEPAELPNAGGATVSIIGANFPSGASLRFGTQNAGNAVSVSTTQLQITSPASAASGPVNLTAYFSNNWIALGPAAFSFGPSIAEIIPNAGPNSGGSTIEIYGFGFGSDPGQVTVTIGGQAANVKSVDAFPSVGASLGLDASYPFSLERITVSAPAGTAGKADVSVNSPSGSATQTKSFQFLASSQTFADPSLYKFVLYDPSRQFVFLTATDHVGVFDLSAQVFRNPLQPPPNGPPPDAALRGLTLTPDGSQLVVADFGAQSVYLINPDGVANNGVKVPVGGVAGYLNSGPAKVAATSAQSVFVGLSGEGNSSEGCNGCLGQLNLIAAPPTFQTAPQADVTSIVGAPLLQADSTGDMVFLAFRTASGGPLASWSAVAPNSFQISAANDISSDLSAAADGSIFALRSNNALEIRGTDLTLFSTAAAAEVEQIPQRVAVPGITLHPTGALVYEPFLDGPPPTAPPATGIRGGIDIRDAHNGKLRLRIYLPEPFAMLNTDIDGLHGSFLTTDENGKRLFAITTSGFTVVQLASVPLGIGTLAPASGTSAGGVTVTIRGSGFESGMKAILGGKQASVTFKDMDTLTLVTPALAAGAQQLVLTNPDGETVSLDAAFETQ
jgi:hypothetical protein